MLPPTDVAHALLSPVRWFGPATDAAYIPGVFVWTVLLPVTALGCWDLLRRGPAAARGVVLSALGFLYLYTCVFQGPGFTRQRYTVEILLLLAALHAFARFPQRAFTWTAMSACAVAVVQLAQALDVPRDVLTAGVLTVSAAGATACLAHLLRRKRREPSRPRRRAPGRHAAHSATRVPAGPSPSARVPLGAVVASGEDRDTPRFLRDRASPFDAAQPDAEAARS
jgi:hypothetical protein